MKFLITIALIATVASAAIIKPTPVSNELAAIQEVIAAINSPSTDPATAAALEQMVLDLLGVNPEPVAVGPAIVDNEPISVGPAIIETNPIAIGPEIIDFPLPDGGAVSAPVEVAPVIVGPSPIAPQQPLVQIIVNVNAPSSDSVIPAPAVVPEVAQPEPIIIVDQAPIAPEPVIIVDQSPIAPEPVIIVESPTVVEPVQVVDTPTVVEPVQVIEIPIISPEPVIIGTPVLPSPAVVLPETLN